ncbi:MAG: MATE family efflux transporter, partial [Lachnospiraceae bacterium]|nr:MATE family efflux transporter [Lachnospiraceae bacterium]
MAARLFGSKTDFTEGGIISKLILFSIPLILGELFQNLYHSVDSLVVGNLVSDSALAAVNVCQPITNLLIAFFNGMSLGSSVLVSHVFGRGERDQIAPAMRTAFAFAIAAGLLLSAVGVIFSPQFLWMTDVNAEIYAEALLYLRICMIGTMFTVIYNIGAGVLRAVGDSRSPFLILVVSSLFNIGLDLLFVAVFRWDIAGVGIATVLSQFLSVLLVFRAMRRSEKDFRLDFRSLREHRSYVGEILSVGLPAGMQGSIVSISNIFIWRYVNSFDSTAVTAGVGVAMRLDKFVAMPVKSIGLAMTTFAGQNAGAGKHSRSRKGILSGFLVSFGVSVTMGIIVYLAAPFLVSLFNRNEEIVSIGVAMMRTIIPFYTTMAVREIFFGA